jgi:hypothetical protein
VRIVDLPLTPEKVLRGLSTQAPRSANGDARREGRGLLPVS